MNILFVSRFPDKERLCRSKILGTGGPVSSFIRTRTNKLEIKAAPAAVFHAGTQ